MATALRVSIWVVLAGILMLPSIVATPPPELPTTVIGVHQSDGTHLIWNPSLNARFYTLYRGATPDSLQVIGVTDQFTFVDSSAPTGISYYAIGMNNERPVAAQAVGGEGCISVYTSPPGAGTHLDSCVGS